VHEVLQPERVAKKHLFVDRAERSKAMTQNQAVADAKR
jgi:hypothetical protein